MIGPECPELRPEFPELNPEHGPELGPEFGPENLGGRKGCPLTGSVGGAERAPGPRRALAARLGLVKVMEQEK